MLIKPFPDNMIHCEAIIIGPDDTEWEEVCLDSLLNSARNNFLVKCLIQTYTETATFVLTYLTKR